MRIFLGFLLCLFFTSCTGFNSKGYKPSQKQILVNEIRHIVAEKLKNEEQLYPCGTGAQMMNEIKMLALSFDYYKPININEARELLVKATDCFITVVNQDKRIHSYLYNYPFTAQNIEIRIFLHNLDGTNVDQTKLRVVSMIEGVLEYDIDDPKGGLFETVLRENYEEAIERIKETKAL